jgi:hypothetical protein
MSSKLSIEDVLANLEAQAKLHREQEAFHAQKESHHRDQRAVHAAELEKVLHSLETFRTAAASAVDLAQTVARLSQEEELPPPGRLMAGRLVRLVAESPGLKEPFVPTEVAEEVNRRFGEHLKKPVGSRAASDVLRRMLAEGTLRLVRKGTPFHESQYARR